MRLFAPTFNNPAILTTELADPLVWDRLFYSGEQTLYSVLELSLDSDIIKIRQAHVQLNLRDYSAALAILGSLQTAPSQGVRLLCYFDLELHDQILEAVIPRPRLPLEFENAVYAHFAKSLVYSVKEKYNEALEHLAFAEEYAAMLGLANRLGFIRLERERIKMWLGCPDPQRVEQLSLLVQNPKGKEWSNHLLSSTNLYAGRYEMLINTLTSNPSDVVLVQALMNKQQTHKAESEVTALVDMVKHLWQGRYERIGKIQVDGLEEAYARVIYSLAQYKLKQFHLVLHNLGDAPPIQPDAKVWWFLLRFGLAVRLDYPVSLDWSVFTEALGNLQQYRHVLGFAAAHLPYELWLVSHHLPHPALVTARLEIPTLINREFKHGNYKVAVAPQTAQALQHDARQGEDLLFTSLHRMERKRYKDMLQARGLNPERVVIQGGLVRRLERLQSRSPHQIWTHLLQKLAT